jgi:type IV pilus assembly protein PilB
MRISDDIMKKLLIQSGIATEEQINALTEKASNSNRSLQDMAVQQELVDDKILAKAFSEYAKIPYIELTSHDISTETIKKIPERVARQYNAVLFSVLTKMALIN